MAKITLDQTKSNDIASNLPSWSVIGGKFDTMSAAVPTATNAQLKDILVELITTTKNSQGSSTGLRKIRRNKQ